MLNQKIDDNADGIDFHGAAFVDPQGREIPITHELVDAALQQANDFLCPQQGIWAGEARTQN
ncbi:MAG: hypothetical protein ACRBBW_04075 [Cellvibrionaceae bacterium]